MKSKIVECPRDAMQGIKTWIPTENKIAYLNLLLKAGDILSSFVSIILGNNQGLMITFCFLYFSYPIQHHC